MHLLRGPDATRQPMPKPRTGNHVNDKGWPHRREADDSDTAPPPASRDVSPWAAYYTNVLGWPTFTEATTRPTGHSEEAPQGSFSPDGHHVEEPNALPDSQVPTDSGVPPAAVVAPCIAFDALALPRDLGLAFLAEIWSSIPPCFTTKTTVTVLVQPGTGDALLDQDTRLELHRGPDEQVTLPPSPGHKWDTLPWLTELAQGDELTGALQRASSAYPPAPPTQTNGRAEDTPTANVHRPASPQEVAQGTRRESAGHRGAPSSRGFP